MKVGDRVRIKDSWITLPEEREPSKKNTEPI